MFTCPLTNMKGYTKIMIMIGLSKEEYKSHKSFDNRKLQTYGLAGRKRKIVTKACEKKAGFSKSSTP